MLDALVGHRLDRFKNDADVLFNLRFLRDFVICWFLLLESVVEVLMCGTE